MPRHQDVEQANARRVEEMLRVSAESIERRDREAGKRQIEAFWHEDCEWSPLIAGVEGASTYHGREGVLQFFEDFLGSFEVRYHDIEFEQVGDVVIWLSRMEVRGRESGVEVERELGVVYELDEGLIRHGKAYDSHAAALRAAEELAHA
jgi:ketosteroid isomerase-like protein